MSDINTVLVFKSIDSKKDDSFNKPGNFITKFNPELVLEDNKKYYLAMASLSMYVSWYNIREIYENNKLKISKDKGKTYSTITFPDGIYDYDDLNRFIQSKIGKLSDNKSYGINISFDLLTYKVLIKLNEMVLSGMR